MKKLLIFTAILLASACSVVHNIAPATAPTPGTPDAVTAEVKTIDPLAKILTSPIFVEHAHKALNMAGTKDQIFTQCVAFGLDLGIELKAKPLVVTSQLALVNADPSCPLCVLEAKRQDLAALESGDLGAQVANVRARLRDIKKRTALACGPLVLDETNVAGHASDLFGKAASLFGGLL